MIELFAVPVSITNQLIAVNQPVCDGSGMWLARQSWHRYGDWRSTAVSFFLLLKVGAFLKSPKFPIWILGSETHLSVFFTKVS